MRMLGEMAAVNPTSGSFAHYAHEAIGPWAGFMIGWLYWFFWVIAIALEATAAAAIIQYWYDGIPLWLLSLLLTVALTLTNVLSVKAFGEFEYWFSLIKVASIVVFLGLGAFIIFGIAPNFNAVGMTNLVEQGGFTKWFWRCSNGCRHSYFSLWGQKSLRLLLVNRMNL